MAFGDLIAVAEQFGDQGRRYFGDEVLQRLVPPPRRFPPTLRSRCMIDCGSRCVPGWQPGNSHRLATMPPPVRRLGRLRGWWLSTPAKGARAGTGSAPGDMRISRGLSTIAAVFNTAILVSGCA